MVASNIRAKNAGPLPQRAVLASILLAGRWTTSPIRLNIQVTRLETWGGRGGVEVAITVMDSFIAEAVLGIARTTLHNPSFSGSVGVEE